MIVESPYMLLEFVYTSVSDQRRLLRQFFFKNVLVIAFSIFCFGISALGLFYLSALCGFFLIVLAESGGGRIILLLYYLIFIQKSKIFASLHHYASLHFAFCMVLALGFLREVLVRISYRNDCICHLKKIFHFT